MAPDNVERNLNIRGSDNPNSPIPNCRLKIGKTNEIFLITQKQKISKIIKERKLSIKQRVDPKKFKDLISNIPFIKQYKLQKKNYKIF